MKPTYDGIIMRHSLTVRWNYVRNCRIATTHSARVALLKDLFQVGHHVDCLLTLDVRLNRRLIESDFANEGIRATRMNIGDCGDA